MNTRVLQRKVADYQQVGLQRQRLLVKRSWQESIQLEQRQCINFSSSDYLGIRSSSPVKQALVEGAEQFGLGSGASALVCGYHQVHQQLEAEFADFLQRDRAILLGSGYLANLGVISALADRKSVIFADKLCHASILDGIILSRAKYFRYQHQNNLDLAEKLSDKQQENSLVITESVFSMEGDITDIPDLIQTINQQAVLMVDDAHGIGVLGQHGRGIVEHAGLTQTDVPILITPLGKALGSYGAIVSGSQAVIDGLAQFARSYVYSTALPPLLAYATLAALAVVRKDGWRRDQLQENLAYFHQQMDKAGLDLVNQATTPIRSLIVGDNNKVMEIQATLKKAGIVVAAIRPPTVPVGGARVRISLNCYHSKQSINQLITLLRQLL